MNSNSKAMNDSEMSAADLASVTGGMIEVPEVQRYPVGDQVWPYPRLPLPLPKPPVSRPAPKPWDLPINIRPFLL